MADVQLTDDVSRFEKRKFLGWAMPLATVISWLLLIVVMNVFFGLQSRQFALTEFAEGIAATCLLTSIIIIPFVVFMSMLGPKIWLTCDARIQDKKYGRTASAHIATIITVALSAVIISIVGFGLLSFYLGGKPTGGFELWVILLVFIIIPGLVVGIPFTVTGLRFVE